MTRSPYLDSLLVGTMLLLAAAPAGAQRRRHLRQEATPNIGSLFARDPQALDTPAKIIAALETYNRIETRLFVRPTLDPKKIAAHWRGLRRIRRALETNLLSENEQDLTSAELRGLRRQITVLIEASADMIYVQVDTLDERLERAGQQRLEDLLAIAQLGNRLLGLNVSDVLGIPVEGGGVS